MAERYWEAIRRLESENERMSAALTFIVSQQDRSFMSTETLLIQCIEQARAAITAGDRDA